MGVSGYGAAADHAGLSGLPDGDPHRQYSVMVTSTAALRDSAGRFGRIHVAEDTGRMSFDTGNGWVDLVTRAEQDVLVAEVDAAVAATVAEAEALLPDLRVQMLMEVGP